jgi:hypothetical protein
MSDKMSVTLECDNDAKKETLYLSCKKDFDDRRQKQYQKLYFGINPYILLRGRLHITFVY